MVHVVLRIVILAAFSSASAFLHAGGGLLGIDRRLDYDNSDIWRRIDQNVLQYGSIAANLSLALWEGGESRLGRTAWQSVDSMAVAGLLTIGTKQAFGRLRPSQSDDPNNWGRKDGRSFPSGEVANISAIVTPYVLEYGHDRPAIYALELLPAYDAYARMKLQAHWQTDVLAGFALGTGVGYYMHKQQNPVILSVMPHAVVLGIKKQF